MEMNGRVHDLKIYLQRKRPGRKKYTRPRVPPEPGGSKRDTCCYHFKMFVCLFWRDSPTGGHGLLIHEVSRSHTTTRHSRSDSSRRVISSSQRLLTDNKLHSQHTDIHSPGGIRNHDLSRRAAAVLRLRPRGHWNGRHSKMYVTCILVAASCTTKSNVKKNITFSPHSIFLNLAGILEENVIISSYSIN